ncbi:MAG TPA: cation-translocating P-type ATPase, partial [Thiotrichales bacterium]|nr:cation-translocating P-type ATPase [Thiotrichales bacterium]
MSGHDEQGFSGSWWQFPPLRNALLAGLVALPAYLFALAGLLDERIETWLYWLAIPVGAWYWAREGIEELFDEHVIGISMLMIAATVGSGLLGMWEEAAALVVLYGAAEGIEEFTFARTRTAIRALLDLAPKEARVLRDGNEVMIPASELKPGERFIVRPGESLATDGVIVRGETSLDESAVTGESVPVDRAEGEKVFAASINGQGAITVEATAAFADNTLSSIIHLVEQAQEQKGRAQQWMERFGRRYTPAVFVGAVLLLLLPWLNGLDMTVWSERAVILLVAAAPCALVISLPIAMAAGIAGAGKRGILIKGGAHLEHLGIIHTIAFDKTGTLTRGKPQVTDVVVFDSTGFDADEVISLAAAIEQHSEHPLARAIVRYARDNAITIKDSDQFQALTGAGAKASIEKTEWFLGNPGLYSRQAEPADSQIQQISALQAQGKTVVLLFNRQGIAGLIAIQDVIREGVHKVIQRLHQLGIKTVMLTGDNPLTAERIAAQIGIDDVRAGLKPADKV